MLLLVATLNYPRPTSLVFPLCPCNKKSPPISRKGSLLQLPGKRSLPIFCQRGHACRFLLSNKSLKVCSTSQLQNCEGAGEICLGNWTGLKMFRGRFRAFFKPLVSSFVLELRLWTSKWGLSNGGLRPLCNVCTCIYNCAHLWPFGPLF